MEHRRWRAVEIACLYGFCALVAWTGTTWWARISEQRREIAIAERPAEAVPGDTLPALVGKDLQDQDLRISFRRPGRKTLLAVFDPSCPFSQMTWPTWERLAAGVPPDATVAINIGTKPWMRTGPSSQSAPLTVVTMLDLPSKRAFAFIRTPQTVVVDEDGRIEGVWPGPLSDSDIEAIHTLIDRRSAAKDGKSPAD